MGIDCKINLPLYVRADKVLNVIQKIVGEEYIKTTFSSQTSNSVDYNLPSSEDNAWYIQFKNNINPLVSPAVYSMLALSFTDISGEKHNWNLHTEDEYEEYKMLMPRSSIFALAVGKRLVDFFGGNIIFCDVNDEISYSNDNPVFGKKTKEQDSDNRWHQFYNALNHVTLITSKEMEEMKEHAAYVYDEEEKLISYLKKIENYHKLEAEVPQKNKTSYKNKL